MTYYNGSIPASNCVELSDVGRIAEGGMLSWSSFIPLEAEPEKRPDEEDFQGDRSLIIVK